MNDTIHPNDKDRQTVAMFTACGIRQRKIADILNMPEPVLVDNYAYELEHGSAVANATVASTLYSKATGGNVTACIFWLKAQAGWKDNDLSITHKGDFGSALRKALGVGDAANDNVKDNGDGSVTIDQREY